MKSTIATVLLVSGVAFGPRQETSELPTQEAFDLQELVTRGVESKRPWTGFLDRPTLSCGVYRLAAGVTDGQGPHDHDEVYHVVEGKARFVAGDEAFEARAGSIFFVERNVAHRFLEIEEDLVVLVFFSKALPEER